MLTATGVTADDLKAKGRKVVRKAGKQILLIASGEQNLRRRQSLPA